MVKDHNGPVCHGNFRILDKSYNNTFKRKVAEALLIEKHKSFLNIQEKSVKLELTLLLTVD